MAPVFPQQALDFMAELSENNSTEWFQANKKRYERELKAPARALVGAVNELIAEISPDHASEKPEKHLNRINRDIRFSKDKTPYNTHIWAGWGPGGERRGGGAGFFIGVSPSSFGVGAGVWQPEKAQLVALREHLAEHHQVLSELLEEPELKAAFGPLHGEGLKRVPAPFPQDHPAGEWLKLKSFVVRGEGDVAVVPTAGFVAELGRRLRLVEPVVRFFNDGLGVG